MEEIAGIDQKGNGQSRGILRRVGSKQFQKEFISPGESIEDVIAKAVFRDERQRNAAIIYYSQLSMFSLDRALYNFKLSIIGTSAVDGRGRREALQGHVGIFWPDNASKDDREKFSKMQKSFRDRDHSGESDDVQKPDS